jgi:hypothetical protein
MTLASRQESHRTKHSPDIRQEAEGTTACSTATGAIASTDPYADISPALAPTVWPGVDVSGILDVRSWLQPGWRRNRERRDSEDLWEGLSRMDHVPRMTRA